jgi:3-dehydroquinate dehydratase type I
VSTPEVLPIAVAVPVIEFGAALALAARALEEKAQYIEYRLDYMPDPGVLTDEAVARLVAGTQGCTILTFRHPGEGGQCQIPEPERLVILRRLIAAKPTYVDVEARLPQPVLAELAEIAVAHGTGLIYSYHNFKGTPSQVDSETLYHTLVAKAPGFEQPGPADVVLKIIFTARVPRDNMVALELCRIMSERSQKVACFCMGEQGIYSRVNCIRNGAAFSYASIGDATAPGQLSIREFYAMLQETEVDQAWLQELQEEYFRELRPH